MQHAKNWVCTIFTLVFLLCVSSAGAQPVANAAVNVASFAHPDLPNGDLAQGGMFTVFGVNLGPGAIVQAQPFPFPTQLGGVSVEVTVGGVTRACFLVFAVSSQVAAILPSNTPVGAGTLTVTFNGRTSAPLAIDVVAHSLGVFAINQAGSGPGVFTDPQFAVNTLFHSAKPGETWSAWATGLSAVSGDEAGGALPGDLTAVDVKVWIGNRQAQVVYRGRSGCCSAVDQIVFVMPSGVFGCWVPVRIDVEGVPSNTTTMSISPNGGACSDAANGLSGAVLSAAQNQGRIRFGSINLNRIRISLAGAFPSQVPPNTEFKTDSASADFQEFDLRQIQAWSGIGLISTIGACTVFQFSGEETTPDDPTRGRPLDAGPSLSITGPKGTEQMSRTGAGSYLKLFGFGGLPSFLKAAGALGRRDQFDFSGFIDPGPYEVKGSGGADVGAFTATHEVPQELTWTNQQQIDSVDRSRSLKITYTGGSPAGFVQIFGFSPLGLSGDSIDGGAVFFCRADVSAGMFEIPQPVLGSLPASPTIQGQATGGLAVGGNSSSPFSAAGLDFGVFSQVDMSLRVVDYR